MEIPVPIISMEPKADDSLARRPTFSAIKPLLYKNGDKIL
jgi:hypothetical protein